MTIVPANITAEVMEHADGRPVAYVDATAVAVFVYQEPDGTHVIDVVTCDDIPPGKLRLLFDGGEVPVRATASPGGDLDDRELAGLVEAQR